MIGIYKITNPKGKIYIGQSIDILKRWKGHKYSPSSIGRKLSNSYIKYGHATHVYEIIEECAIDILTEREKYWIIFYDSIENGLNSTMDDKNGYRHTPETRKLISQSNKGRIGYYKGKKRPDHSEFMKKVSYNKGPKSDKQREKMSNSRKGMVSCKDIRTGKMVVVPKDEFDKNDFLIGTTANREIFATRKRILCIELNEEFDSIIAVNKKYGLSESVVCKSLKSGIKVYKKLYPLTGGISFKYT